MTSESAKVVYNSPGLVDFAIGLINSVLDLPDRQSKFFWSNSNYRSTLRLVQSIVVSE